MRGALTLLVAALLAATVATGAVVRIPLHCGGPTTVACGPASAAPPTCGAGKTGCGPAHGH
jgi:hypothetical protein